MAKEGGGKGYEKKKGMGRGVLVCFGEVTTFVIGVARQPSEHMPLRFCVAYSDTGNKRTRGTRRRQKGRKSKVNSSRIVASGEPWIKRETHVNAKKRG